jgi:hypothetical protein
MIAAVRQDPLHGRLASTSIVLRAQHANGDVYRTSEASSDSACEALPFHRLPDVRKRALWRQAGNRPMTAARRVRLQVTPFAVTRSRQIIGATTLAVLC